MRMVVLAVRFLSELATLVALAVWGWLWPETWVRFVLFLAAPVVAAALWGRFAAPSSRHRLADPGRLVFEIALFAVTTACLLLLGATGVAIGYAVVTIGTALLMRVTPEHPLERQTGREHA
jgi:hypothetical protein